MEKKNPEQPAAEIESVKKKSLLTNNLFITGVVFILVALALFLFWRSFPGMRYIVKGTPTATLPIPTITFTHAPTETPLPSPTASSIPTQTNTPMPASAYSTTDLFNINPGVPGPAEEVIVLNDNTSVTPVPEFIHPQWYTSDAIGGQLGIQIIEPFYATVGYGAATWMMDVPLTPGYYELFVLDTTYSSAGTLDFSVKLGEEELTPILGDKHIDYLTTSGQHTQAGDIWHSLGVYTINGLDLLSISSWWEAREQTSIVAVDRVLVVRLPYSVGELIDLLPANEPRYVIDDSITSRESSDTWLERSDQLSWGDGFQTLVNPVYDATVTWKIPDLVVPGIYEVMIWSPKVQGNAEAFFKLILDGQPYQGAMIVNLGNLPGDHWVSLGTWDVSNQYNIPIDLALQMEIKGGTMGEFIIDAIAFIKR